MYRIFPSLMRQLPTVGSLLANQTTSLHTSSARAKGSMSFFNHLTAEALWKSATSVSNAGKKRGRARGRKMIKNLNRGQQLGCGSVNMVWPGLNAPVMKGREVVQQQQLPPDPSRQERIFKMRDAIEKFRQLRVAPLERGWSGTKMPGRSIGSPDPIGEETFEQFDCRVLEMKQVANMTGTLGRVRRFSILVVTGNKNGLFSTALAKAVDAKTALKNARNMSIKKLRFVERFENRTVYHDFHHQIDSTGVFVKRVPAGYGLVGHRALKTICEVAGIRDLYFKAEGRMNLQKIVKCFVAGLEKQELHQELADRKRVHVVEFKPENKDFPIVLASPKTKPPRKDATEIDPDENLRFNEMYNEGKVRLIKPKKPPFYHKLPSWQKKLVEMELQRGWDKVRLNSWMKQELEPSKLYDNLLPPDPGFVRASIDKPKNKTIKEEVKLAPMKRIGG